MVRERTSSGQSSSVGQCVKCRGDFKVQSVPEAGRPSQAEGESTVEHLDAGSPCDPFARDAVLPVLSDLIEGPAGDLRDLALTCLKLVKHVTDGRQLARVLQGEDPVAVSLCEQALWTLWFQAAGPDAAVRLHRAMDLSAERETTAAVGLLDELIQEHPSFAEAYHQRGMVYSLCEEHTKSLSDFLRTVQLNPIHFAAMANLGHCCVQLGRYSAARDWYLAALQVHPRLPGVRQMLRHLRELAAPRAPH